MAEKKKAEVKYSKYEKARILGSRALQISMGAPILVELGKEELERLKYNPIEIAKLEYEKGLIPIEVNRQAPHRAVAQEQPTKAGSAAE